MARSEIVSRTVDRVTSREAQLKALQRCDYGGRVIIRCPCDPASPLDNLEVSEEQAQQLGKDDPYLVFEVVDPVTNLQVGAFGCLMVIVGAALVYGLVYSWVVWSQN